MKKIIVFIIAFITICISVQGQSPKGTPTTNPNVATHSFIGYLYDPLQSDPLLCKQVFRYWDSTMYEIHYKNIKFDSLPFKTSGTQYFVGIDNSTGYLSTVHYTTLSGYGITDAYPLVGNPSNFLTSFTEIDPTVSSSVKAITSTNISNWNTAFGWGNHAGLYPLLSGSYSNPSWINSLPYSKITGTPTIPAAQVNSDWVSSSGVSQILNKPTAGTGISLTSNSIINTAPDQVVSLTAGTNIIITGTYPNFTISAYVPTPHIVTRIISTGATTYTISTTKQAEVYYTVTCSVTNPLLAGTSTATCYLEYSTDGGTTWNSPTDASNSSAVALTVTVQLTNGQSGTLSGIIPANALTRLRSSTSGTATVTYTSGQETY